MKNNVNNNFSGHIQTEQQILTHDSSKYKAII